MKSESAPRARLRRACPCATSIRRLEWPAARLSSATGDRSWPKIALQRRSESISPRSFAAVHRGFDDPARVSRYVKIRNSELCLSLGDDRDSIKQNENHRHVASLGSRRWVETAFLEMINECWRSIKREMYQRTALLLAPLASMISRIIIFFSYGA